MHRFTIYSVTDVGENSIGTAIPVPTLNAKKALRIYAEKKNIKLLALEEECGKYSASACGLYIRFVGTQRIKIKTPVLLKAHYLNP